MIESLIRRDRRGVAARPRRDRRDEHIGAAEVYVDPAGAADDGAAENILKPGRGRLRVGAAQVDVIPGDDRHCRFSRWLVGRRPTPALAATRGGREILAVAFRHDHPHDPRRTGAASQYCYVWMQLFPRPSIVRAAAETAQSVTGLLDVRCSRRTPYCRMSVHDHEQRVFWHRIDRARP